METKNQGTKHNQKENLGDRYGYIVNESTWSEGKRMTEPVGRFRFLGDALDFCYLLACEPEDDTKVYYVFDKRLQKVYRSETIKIAI